MNLNDYDDHDHNDDDIDADESTFQDSGMDNLAFDYECVPTLDDDVTMPSAKNKKIQTSILSKFKITEEFQWKMYITPYSTFKAILGSFLRVSKAAKTSYYPVYGQKICFYSISHACFMYFGTCPWPWIY